MSRFLSYQPPARAPQPQTAPVRRRHVVYVPGYDPAAETRARMLFVRELIRYAKRFGLTERVISKAEPLPDSLGLHWQVDAGTETWRTQTTIEVLRWDDIVREDFARSMLTCIALLVAGFVHLLVTGVLLKLFRLNWKFAGVVIYPMVMILLLCAVALGVGFGGAGLLGLATAMPAWARITLVLALAVAVCAAAKSLYEEWFVWHLIHDFVFNWQHGNGWRTDYEARVDRFAAHLAALAHNSDADEIVVIGHSSGSAMAIESVARALVLDPDLGRHRAALCLLTVGACVPIVAFVPGAHRCRAAMARLIVARSILWVEYQAPQDWMNTSGFNPVTDLGFSIPETERFNPVIRSARFRDIMTDKTYRSILMRPFRIHFQYLMASERPGEYDYIAILCGPRSLADRALRPDEPMTGAPDPDDHLGEERQDDILQRVLRPERVAPAP